MPKSFLNTISLGLCLYLAFCAPRRVDAAPASSTPTQLSVTPTSNQSATQVVGSPAAPSSFTYQLRSNRGSLNWTLNTVPAWLCPSARTGKTAATVVLTICGQQPAGTYTASVSFKASTNTSPNPASIIMLVVTDAPPPPPPPSACSGYLLDDVGGHLLTVAGDSITC